MTNARNIISQLQPEYGQLPTRRPHRHDGTDVHTPLTVPALLAGMGLAMPPASDGRKVVPRHQLVGLDILDPETQRIERVGAFG